MKKIGGSLLIIGAVLLGAVWLVDNAQTFESHYDTYQKLKESELMTQGWVSHVIPNSSYDINETHRVSGGIVTVRFRFQPGDLGDMESRCAILDGNDPAIRRYRCREDVAAVVVRLDASGQGQILIE
ncbi:MAG: hypothetical protein K2Q17_17920 [Nitrospiraceae bacterium]|jgi:hypothetical protein|uniref:hypothetical protein n=1 Tax=Nitrospira cf. moscoviensis SBR1015 TaxID=96242 RepID=UPI000A0A0A34|nr:hypothetical protein [Nitrospira cf. moscoviensis SBR1015]MBY0249532.1 hypothetical protein [Nitrospiraceae bacterium]OQW32347.1 MAG: hypothetical protein A4E20_14120 [Nitrospira sp. SG-bin2]